MSGQDDGRMKYRCDIEHARFDVMTFANYQKICQVQEVEDKTPTMTDVEPVHIAAASIICKQSNWLQSIIV